MNLIFIYGPPASGKLTIAEELVKQTGYRLCHNHLTMDLAREIYPEFNELRFNLVDKLRLDVFEYAAQHGTNLISTVVYGGGEDDEKFVADVVSAIKNADGDVHFVELTAPDEVLLDRVDNESRQRFHKLKDREVLKAKLEGKLLSNSVPYEDVLKIDTSTMSPSEAAAAIAQHFDINVQPAA